MTLDPLIGAGGIEKRTLEYGESLRETGFTVEVASFRPVKELHMGFLKRVPFLLLSSSFPRLFGSLRIAIHEVGSKRLDSVFLLSGGTSVIGAILLIHARLSGRRSYIMFYGRDLALTRRRPLNKLILYLTSLLAVGVATNSKFTMKTMPVFVRKGSHILYPAVDPEMRTWVDKPPAEATSLMVLFVGRLVRRKGLDVLLRAHRDLLARYPHLELRVVGDGPDRSRLSLLAASLGVAGSVQFLGELHGSKLANEYRDCTVFAMPSVQTSNDVEGFGTVFLEAGLFAKPSVGTWSGGIPEAVVHESTGLLVAPGNVKELSEAINRLLSDYSSREAYGRMAYERVMSHFTLDRSIERLRELLSSS